MLVESNQKQSLYSIRTMNEKLELYKLLDVKETPMDSRQVS